jgi:hypothetical protein
MANWILLSPEKAHSLYRVPLVLAAADRNYFYGTQHDPRDGDGPWPLAALLCDRPHVITLQIYTIEAEERAMASFNPITQSGGYLNLERGHLMELARLVYAYAAKLPLGTNEVGRMFRQIDPSKLPDFGLHADQFPDSRDRYYHQTYDPLDEEEKARSTQTVLICSSGQGSRSRLYFKIAQFPRQALKQPSFDVLDNSCARVNLDRGGADELARLLATIPA